MSRRRKGNIYEKILNDRGYAERDVERRKVGGARPGKFARERRGWEEIEEGSKRLYRYGSEKKTLGKRGREWKEEKWEKMERIQR